MRASMRASSKASTSACVRPRIPSGHRTSHERSPGHDDTRGCQGRRAPSSLRRGYRLVAMPASHCFPRANPQAPRNPAFSLTPTAACPCCTAPRTGHCVSAAVRQAPGQPGQSVLVRAGARVTCGRRAPHGQSARAECPRAHRCATLTRLPRYTRGRGDAVPCITSCARPPTLPTSAGTSPVCHDVPRCGPHGVWGYYRVGCNVRPQTTGTSFWGA